MEQYIWENNASKSSVEALFGTSTREIPHVEEYSAAVTRYMNEGNLNYFYSSYFYFIICLILGENEYTISKYEDSVRKLLNISSLNA